MPRQLAYFIGPSSKPRACPAQPNFTTYALLPQDCYLAFMLNEFSGQSILVFVATCNNAQRLALLLRNLGFGAICLHG